MFTPAQLLICDKNSATCIEMRLCKVAESLLSYLQGEVRWALFLGVVFD